MGGRSGRDAMMRVWRTAADSASAVSLDRNRVVDFLRAVSIVVVVIGHWLMAAPEVRPNGDLLAGHVLADVPWTQWLTWVFQVMPVFFMVGGYSNAASWRSALRQGLGYESWVNARLRRLVIPVLALLAFWGVFASVLLLGGLDPELLLIGSQTALVPVWFLAVYIAVVAITPLTIRVWERWGMRSILAGIVAAVAVDAVSLLLAESWVGWLNYLFVWGTVHQFGYAWRDGRLDGRVRWGLAAAGLGALVALTQGLAYPVSMVGVPGAALNNTLPPRLPLLALGAVQTGLLLGMERPLGRLLTRDGPWTATVLVTSMIMTIYLWHLTTMVLVLAVLLALDGFGLHVVAGSGTWWATRPIWLLVMAGVTAPAVIPLARFERPKTRMAAPARWRGIIAVLSVCLGLALLAYFGVGGPDGLNWIALSLPFVGALVGGVVGWSGR